MSDLCFIHSYNISWYVLVVFLHCFVPPPNSDWSLSMHNTTSVPENIFSEPMSPGLIANSGPSRAAPMNAGHAHNGSQSSRGNIKRGGAGNRRREPLTYGTHTDDNHHSRERAGSELSAGAAPGIALDAEDLGLDEEAQEHLSNNLKAINDRFRHCCSNLHIIDLPNILYMEKNIFDV